MNITVSPYAPLAALVRPVSLTPAATDTLATAWRGSCREVAEHLQMIKAHQKAIAERNETLSTGALVHSPKYIAYARRELETRLPRYLAAVRRVTEYEQKMDRAGIRYAIRSDDWRA